MKREKECSAGGTTPLNQDDTICSKSVLNTPFLPISKNQFLAIKSNSFHACVGTVLVMIFS